MSVGDNRRYCECMGFYDGAGSCLPYDPEIHEAEPWPPNQFWGGIFDWFSNTEPSACNTSVFAVFTTALTNKV